MLDPTVRFPDPLPRREPVFNIPPVILAVLATLFALHAMRLAIPRSWDEQLLLRLAFIPGTFTFPFDPAPVVDALRTLAVQSEAGLQEAQLGRFLLMQGGLQPWTVLTYGLLHGGWTHIGLNALWLLAFGSPVARRLGPRRCLLFLCASTVAGAVAHFLTHPTDLQPVIGASAAVSGCMGAALRFMFQPEVPVSAIIGLSEQGRAEAFQQPLLTLRDVARDRRAMAFLVVWFVANLLFGVGAVSFGSTDATVAWQAHIGGFLLGLLALPLFDRRIPRAFPQPGGKQAGGKPLEPDSP